MLLKIKELKGGELTVNVEPSDSVAMLKSKISALSDISQQEIKLLLAGKVLSDEKTLDEYKITEISKIMLTKSKIDLKSLIQKALAKFYDSEKASTLTNLILANMKQRAQDYSLDDVERISESWSSK